MKTAIGSIELARLLGHWAEPNEKLGDSLAASLTRLVEAGLLTPGSHLPPQRELAASLHVSRGTVAHAYAILAARDLVVSRGGSSSRINSRVHLRSESSGRLKSYAEPGSDEIDLSTGALPASRAFSTILASGWASQLNRYAASDGYAPAGIPPLREAVAQYFVESGVPTDPEQILITSGAQQATWLALRALVAPGNLVVVEEPTYRGALEVMREINARVEGVPVTDQGIDIEQAALAFGRGAVVFYCQTGVHNPTGMSMSRASRAALAHVINSRRQLTVEDTCSADLLFADGGTAPTLAGLVDDDHLISIGSVAKLFWGGVRVGWIRASHERVRALTQLRIPVDLASSMLDQTLAVALFTQIPQARQERRSLLTEGLATTERVIAETFPMWTWSRPHGGSAAWINTGHDTQELSATATRNGIGLAIGPTYSVYDGQRNFIRLPIWHPHERLSEILAALGRG